MRFLTSSLVLVLPLITVSAELTFTDPATIEESTEFPVVLGIILINIARKENQTWSLFRDKLVPMMDSLLSRSHKTNIHFLVITDAWTLREAGIVMENTVSLFITMNLIQQFGYFNRKRSKLKKLSRLKFSYVDIEDLVREERDIIKTMKDHTDMNIVTSNHNEKYLHDLFYLAPLYHKKFSTLERLLMLDIDLGILTSIQDLYDQFDQFGTGDQCIGVAADLSPHYWHKLESFRADNPDTALGQPGSLQGKNTGVALYNLSCLRQSRLFADYTTPSEMTLGDQDWLTVLSFEWPSLFYQLPCEYNVQTSLQYLASYQHHGQLELQQKFPLYHYCVLPHQSRIVHLNGCGPKERQK